MSSLGFSRYRPLGGMNWAPVLGLHQGLGRLTGSAYQSSFNPAYRTRGVGLRACFLNSITNYFCPLDMVQVIKGIDGRKIPNSSFYKK